MWRPSDLFDSGTQLSFLAVAALLFWHHAWGARLAARHEVRAADTAVRAWCRWLMAKGRSWVLASYGLTTCVWLCTVPLIAADFHVISPIGLMLNVGLTLVVILILWCGYFFVAGARVAPPPAGV
jgi:competence protein ComEC